MHQSFRFVLKAKAGPQEDDEWLVNLREMGSGQSIEGCQCWHVALQ